MVAYLFAVSIGFVAGLRTLTAPTAVSWAAYFGWLQLGNSPLAFMAHASAPWLLTALAIGEYIVDKLPSTPSRKLPMPFIARIVSGSLCGMVFGVALGSLAIGGFCGAIGALAGTLSGSAARHALAQRFRSDIPAAFIEDAVTIIGVLVVLSAFRLTTAPA